MKSHQLVPDKQREQSQLQAQRDSFQVTTQGLELHYSVSNELHCRPPGYLNRLQMGWLRDLKGIQLEDRSLSCSTARPLGLDSIHSVREEVYNAN